MFNRFGWKKIVCNSQEDLIKKFPVKNLIGKKITILNAIGSADTREWGTDYYENQVLHRGNPDVDELECCFDLNEPFVIGFADNSTFEIQIVGCSYRFSEDQLSTTDGTGLNIQAMNANLLFKEILNSTITDVVVGENLRIITDSDYSLEFSSFYSNFTRICLCKQNQVVKKIAKECFSARILAHSSYMQENHNTGSYFWITPAIESLDPKSWYGMERAYEAQISIEEDAVEEELSEYLIKYFDPEIHKICRTFEPYKYEHWGTNIYTYETMEKMILDLENNGGWDNLVLQLKLMMKYFPNYKYIEFMGP